MADRISNEIATHMPAHKTSIDTAPAVDLDELPDVSQIYLKIAVGFDEALPELPRANSSRLPVSNSIKQAEPKLQKWEKISLTVILTSIIGFLAGAALAVLILDGKFDLSKQELKALIEVIHHYGKK